MGIAVTVIAGLVGLSVVWYLSRKQRQGSRLASLTDLQDLPSSGIDNSAELSDDLDEIVDSGSFESFLSGVPRYEYEANVLYCEIKRLKSSGNKPAIQELITKLLDDYPRSKAAHLIRKKQFSEESK